MVKSTGELRRETLIAAGWKVGSDLPAKLTRTASIFCRDGAPMRSTVNDIVEKFDKNLSLREIFDVPLFPLATSHPTYIGRSWINIWDRLNTSSGEDTHMQRNLDNGLDIRKIIESLNQSSYDKISLDDCGGCFGVATGHHRIAYLNAVYETLMTNPDITKAEKTDIQDLTLNVTVRKLKSDIYPMIGDKHFTAPSFLPEMVIAEKQAIETARKTAINEALDKISAGLICTDIGVGLKHKILATLSGDSHLAPKEIEKFFAALCTQIRTLPTEYERVITDYYETGSNLHQTRVKISDIETRDRTLRWEIQGLKTSMEDATRKLNDMPNPKLPGNFITKQLDTKEKQGQRAAYIGQQNICAGLNQKSLEKWEEIRTLAQHKSELEKYVDDCMKFIDKINDTYLVACDAANKAAQTVNKIMEVAGSAVGELAERLDVPNPYKRFSGAYYTPINPTRA